MHEHLFVFRKPQADDDLSVYKDSILGWTHFGLKNPNHYKISSNIGLKSVPNINLPSTYKTLFHKVKETLILGQRRIESEKVKIYWETGYLIHVHIKQHKDRADYGTQVVGRLAKDLRMEPSVLHRCVKFAQEYSRSQIVARGPQFKWSH